jgi:hypothetical protein
MLCLNVFFLCYFLSFKIGNPCSTLSPVALDDADRRPFRFDGTIEKVEVERR